MHLSICYLYPHSMSTYGDNGNILCLQRRCEWRGIETIVHKVDIGEPLPEQVDLYFFGGGQDAAQAAVGADLQGEKGDRLATDSAQGVPILAICGGYQLLGISYNPYGETVIPGLGILPVQTVASKDRMVGNLIVDCADMFSSPKTSRIVVGFENHSGKTTIVDTSLGLPLGKVRVGYGNNGTDQTEGCRVQATVGCYLHGSVLPKNPHLADWLLEKACARKEAAFILPPLDDLLETSAHEAIVGRYM